MRKIQTILFFLIFTINLVPLLAQEALIPAFKLKPNDITLKRLAKPGTPFDKVGRRFAILGDESGSFEAWAYPLKLLRNFEFSFFVRNSTRPIHGKDIVRYITVRPEATTLSYTYQSFSTKAIYITPAEEPGALIMLKVDSTEPMTIVCSFFPVLQPMWPAGLGGQYAYWDSKLKAYIISEPTGKNHGLVGSPLASGISYTPAHMLSDIPNEFKIEIPHPKKVFDKYIPICIAGGKGTLEEVIDVYKRLQSDPEKYCRKNQAYYQSLRQNTLLVQTPSLQLNLAFEWAKVALDNLVVDNPDLGKGLVAGLGASGTSGRPGFGWFFGGDAYINSFSLMSLGAYSTVRDSLAFTQKWQREDGKMAHELSQAASYIDWWNDYHYGYIHGDTTPYYIAAMYDYCRMTGDIDFIKESWDSLRRAYEWCLKTDSNNDGLMDNRKAGLGALEYGALTGIETDIYLAAVWTRAAYAMKHLARITGKISYAKKAARHFQRAQKAFNEKFWDDENEFYVYAFNSEGKRVKEISPWNAVGLTWNIGTPERSLSSLRKLSSSELATDWGIRSISNKSKYFQPLNYNYGSVWPFLTGWVAASQFKHHLPQQGYSSLMSTVQHTFDNALGCITEVFSGSHYVWPQEAVAHQGFSTAGVVLPLVRGLLGLEGDALKKVVTFAPHFPADWGRVYIDNYKIGKAIFSFDYRREKGKISVSFQAKNASGYRLQFAPAIGAGSQILSLAVDKEPVIFKIKSFAQVVQAAADIPVKDKAMLLEMEFVPAVEILPAVAETNVGERNKGLKLISVRREGSKLRIYVEGLAGEIYELGIVNEELIESVKGGEKEASKLIFRMPEGEKGTFIPHQIAIHISSSVT